MSDERFACCGGAKDVGHRIGCPELNDVDAKALGLNAKLEAWQCPNCKQLNAGWVRYCGRCETWQPQTFAVVDELVRTIDWQERVGFYSSTPDCEVGRFGVVARSCVSKAVCVQVAPRMIPIPLCAKHRKVAEDHAARACALNGFRDDGTEIISLWQFVRERGVSLVKTWGDGMQRFDDIADTPAYRLRNMPYPASVKYRVMLTKAWAIANAFYLAKRETIEAVIGPLTITMPRWKLARLELPTYERMRNMLLDGDFTDDGDPTGGDYILACRAALNVTQDRYGPREDRAPF